MSQKFGTEVKGFKELARDIREMNDDVQSKHLLKGLQKAATTILIAIRQKAPVRTGKLFFDARIRKERRDWWNPAYAVLFKDAFYARFVEFGWVPRNQHTEKDTNSTRRDKRARARRSGRKVQAKPFIRPAFEQSAGDAGEAAIEEIGNQIERMFRG
jgi:HK97 gp10 family phage protein